MYFNDKDKFRIISVLMTTKNIIGLSYSPIQVHLHAYTYAVNNVGWEKKNVAPASNGMQKYQYGKHSVY